MTTSELDLLQGTLDLLVLRALSWGPNHGYGIARFIREGSAQSFKILDGALYTSLHRMEEREWVESFWGTSDKGKRAKFYRMTTAGRRALKTQQSMWEQYVTAVAGVINLRPQEASV
jgi:PadR family transcriptional regulator, regulatory protein PadR